ASDAMTVPTPVVTPTNASGGPVDETAVLPRVRGDEAAGADPAAGSGAGTGTREGTVRRPERSGPSEAEVTTELPKPPVPPGAVDETAVLPAVPPGAADETAVLPPVRGDGPNAGNTGNAGDGGDGRVPPGYFRDERAQGGPEASAGAVDSTRELPQVEAAEGAASRRRRKRSDWAEETPLDDLPTLADELLGPREEEGPDEDEGGRGRGRRR
ncbi:dTMP kinase, partial [Streptomyces sp. SID8111]|nr:dTMP kinase [Streptomyces sp. SID8111]